MIGMDEKTEITCLADIYEALGKERADKLVAGAIGYSATVVKDELLAAVAEKRLIELDGFMDYRDEEAAHELVGEILEAREQGDGDAEKGVREWLKKDPFYKHAADFVADCYLNGGAASCADIAGIVNDLWEFESDYGWQVSQRIAEELASELEDVEEVDASALDTDELAVDLRDDFGFSPVWLDADSVARMRFPQTVLIADKGCTGVFEADTAHSRHTFDAALEHLWAVEDGEAHVFGEGECVADEEDVANSNLQWLCETQGTTLRDVLAPGSEAWESGFGKALREEILCAAYAVHGHPCVAVLRETTVAEQLALSDAARGRGGEAVGFTAEDAVVGIFDPHNGSAGVLGIQPGRDGVGPITVPASVVGMPMLDDRPRGRDSDRFRGMWTVDSVCGLVGTCWTYARTTWLEAGNPGLAEACEAAEVVEYPKLTDSWRPGPGEEEHLNEEAPDGGPEDHGRAGDDGLCM